MEFLTSNFKELSLYLFDPNKRIYWGYIASAILLALPVFVATLKQTAAKASISGFVRFLFPKHIYFDTSAKHDYALLVLNKLLKAALFPAVVLTMVPVALSVSDALEWVLGTHEPVMTSEFGIMVVFTLLLFIFDDFTRFYLHYLLHKVPFLWEFHKVHHSAKVLTPFTIYRSHPVESYLYACRMALTQGFVVGLCYYLFGPSLKMYDIVGANVFVFAFNIMGSNLRHSHIWLSWGDKVENWFISPAQHQVHHSANPKHFDTNLGSALSVWDRLNRSLIKASEISSPLKLGIGKQYQQHETLWGIYINPFIQAGSKLTARLPYKKKSTTERSNEPR